MEATKTPELAPRSPGRRHGDKRRHLFDKLLPAIVAAIVVVLAVLAVLSISVFNQQSTIRDNQRDATLALDRQQDAAAGGCARLQLVRDDLNVQAWVQYRVISLSQKGPKPKVIAGLLARVDPATRNLITVLLAAGVDAARLYPAILEATQYLPPTDCKQAVANPAGYRPPSPIPFRLVAGCYDPRRNARPEEPCPTP